MSKVDSSNYLNTNQLMEVSSKLVGVSEKTDSSIFKEVKKLDDNKNKTIDSEESVVSKIINLGNKVLNKLANIFGISTETPENSEMNNFEDAQNDSVIQDYFTPYVNKGSEEMTVDKIKSGSLDGMIDKSNIIYTFNAIKEEKLSQGVKIVEESKTFVKFDDGSEIELHKSNKNANRYELIYKRTAEDGSESRGTISIIEDKKDKNRYRYNITTSSDDGKGPSEELLELLKIRTPEKDSRVEGKAYTYSDEGIKIINENDNEESYISYFSYDREHNSYSNKNENYNSDQKTAILNQNHSKKNAGVADSEIYNEVITYNKEYKHQFYDN